MQHQTTRRQFLKNTAAVSTTAAAAYFSSAQESFAGSDKTGHSINVKNPPNVRQTDILFDPAHYTAFPHVVRLAGNELLMAFRQAPRQKQLRHTHPRSIITVIRSYDLGETWDIENASQLAAGGGQEFAPIHFGNGRVGGLLAMHEVVPVAEAKRSRIPQRHQHEYPYSNVGGFWCWSNNHGLTWPLHHNVLFAPGLQTSAPPIRLKSGALLAPSYGSLNQGDPSSAIVHRSDDEGKSWSRATIIARGNKSTRVYYEPAILELKKNHLLAVHRIGFPQNGRHGLFWQNESTDGGKTWTQPVETNILSGACPRLLKFSNGRILLTYGRRYEPYGLYARLSNDDGKSWSDTSCLLRKAPNRDQGYSSSIEIAPGQIFTACYAQNGKGITGITGTFWNVPEA